jgi:hypothetical protein
MKNQLFGTAGRKTQFFAPARLPPEPAADMQTQNTIQLPEKGMTRPESLWPWIPGELVPFTDPQRDLQLIDQQ